MTITIYNSLRDQAEKKLNAIKRKADRYNIPFSFSFGEPYAKSIDIYGTVWSDYDHAMRTVKISTRTVEAIDLTISGEDLICKDGWTAIAQLEHFDNGNLVNRFDREDITPIPVAWRTCKPHCDHCGIDRQRNVTYIVRDKTGAFRQVGSSCLKDYTGIDPRSATAFAELFDAMSVCECNESNYDPDRESRGYMIYGVERVIALAVDQIARNGYHNADSTEPTKEAVGKALRNSAQPTEDGWNKAKVFAEWLKTTDITDSLIRDCSVLAKNEYCKLSHIGRLCYMPIAYDKEMARQAREAERNAKNAETAKTSQHIGSVGDRITVTLSAAEFVTSWETYYGYTYLYKFTDNAGNVLVWFSSDSKDVTKVTTLTGTVKKHDERDGIKQTVVTRCRLI